MAKECLVTSKKKFSLIELGSKFGIKFKKKKVELLKSSTNYVTSGLIKYIYIYISAPTLLIGPHDYK